MSFPSLPNLSVRALTLGLSEDFETEVPELDFDLELEWELEFDLE